MSIRIQCPPAYRSDPDIRRWVELHGIQLAEIGGATYAVISHRCSALTEDLKCSLYGTPERPQLCSEWPATPSAMVGHEDHCGYSWEEK